MADGFCLFAECADFFAALPVLSASFGLTVTEDDFVQALLAHGFVDQTPYSRVGGG